MVIVDPTSMYIGFYWPVISWNQPLVSHIDCVRLYEFAAKAAYDTGNMSRAIWKDDSTVCLVSCLQ